MRTLFAVLVLFLVATLCSSADASITQRLSDTWGVTQFQVGVGNQWKADERLTFQESEPDPVGFTRVQIGLPWRCAIEGQLGRRLDLSDQWVGHAAFTFRIK